MTIQYTPINSFINEFKSLIVTLEQGVGTYNPSIHDDGLGIPTIGYGFNLKVRRSVDAALFASNIYAESDVAEDNRRIAAAQQSGAPPYSPETLTQRQIRHSNLAYSIWSAALGSSAVSTKASTINNIVSVATAGTITEFTLTSAQALNALDAFINGFNAGHNTYTSHVDEFDSFLASNLNINIPRNSREYVVLYDFYFNTGSSLFGSGLKNALSAGNRANAWFEIRYRSNREKLPGIAKRRFYESSLFGLDGPGTTSDDIYTMFAKNRQVILSYERDFTQQSQFNLSGKDWVQVGRSDYGVQSIPYIGEALSNAATDINSRYGVNFDPINIVIHSKDSISYADYSAVIGDMFVLQRTDDAYGVTRPSPSFSR